MWEASGHTELENLSALASFLEQFEEEGFRFGEWIDPPAAEEDTFSLPIYSLGSEATAFIQACYDHGWISGDLNWPDWASTEEAARLRDDPDYLATASAEQLRRLLTVIVRQDRFVNGSLADHFESGLLHRILGRAKELEDENQAAEE